MSIRVDKEMRDALDAIAGTLDRDRSYVVNAALDHYIEMNRWQTAHIQQGLREAEAGKFASQEQVRKTVQRLRRAR